MVGGDDRYRVVCDVCSAIGSAATKREAMAIGEAHSKRGHFYVSVYDRWARPGQIDVWLLNHGEWQDIGRRPMVDSPASPGYNRRGGER